MDGYNNGVPPTYETEIQNGYKIIIRHIFKGNEIKPGSRWMGTGSTIVTVDEVKCYRLAGASDWYEVHYSWESDGEKFTNDKDAFSFQCRYCLIVE